MADVKPFQQATVEAVLKAFRRPNARFLVADEVGLGKTVVAQQIILRMMEAKRGPLVVFYVCSNLSIASQNRRKILEILPIKERSMASCTVDRLTLVPANDPPSHPSLHIYTLTPETSIPIRKNRRRDGRQEERALISCLVKRLWPKVLRGKRRYLFRRNALSYWNDVVKTQRKKVRGNTRLVKAFYESVRTEFGLSKGQHALPVLQAIEEDLQLIAHMRNALAACAIERLQPNLIIFDEFQKFKDLISSNIDDAARRIVERLRGEGGDGKTPLLLLSATPYQLYTRNSDLASGNSHHAEFFELIEFLFGGDERAKVKTKQCEELFAGLQIAIRRGDLNVQSAVECRTLIQKKMRSIISRTERASHDDGWSEHATTNVDASLVGEDIRIFRHFCESLNRKHAGTSVSYWTSIPLPAQTMGSRYKAWEIAEKSTAPSSIPQLTKKMRDEFSSLGRVPHPKLRALLDLVGIENLKLPWLPPSLPWWTLKRQWASSKNFGEKILLFSRFRAVPQSIASLISYALEVELFGKNNFKYTDFTERRLLQPGPGRHALLGYFHPSPWLIQETEPLMTANRIPSQIKRTLKHQIKRSLNKIGIRVNHGFRRNRSMWRLLAQIEMRAGVWEWVSQEWWRVHEQFGRGPDEQGLGRLLQTWDEQAMMDLREVSGRELKALINYAFRSPGVVLGRALRRHWVNAVDETGFYYTLLASWQGLRNYLDNPAFAASMGSEDDTYPSAIMQAIQDGNLEAVLDEQLWLMQTLYSLYGYELANSLRNSLRLRSGIFYLNELKGNWRQRFPLRCHAAMPFTEVRTVTVEGIERTDKPLRTDEIRSAFNSPFWPYVLATTSVGQEGLDFHTWCSNLVHWDLSRNPVDLEQREGRIQRFAGHSIRRHIAKKLGDQVWSDLAQSQSPWQHLAAISEQRLSDDSGLCPWWVYKGAEVNRYVLDVPSSDQKHWLEVMKEQRTLYRLVLGQPNQEDLMNLLSNHSLSYRELREVTLELSAWFSRQERKTR